MTKADIINKIVEDTGLAKKDVTATVVIDAHDYPGFKPAKSFIAKMK